LSIDECVAEQEKPNVCVKNDVMFVLLYVI